MNNPSRSEASEKTQRTLALIFLTLTFESLVLVFARIGELSILRDPLALVMVGLAAFRGGRALAYNTVFEWLRAPFTHVVDDSSGAGQSVEAAGTGLRRVIGELLCCPVCAGSWVALVLTGLLALSYPLGLATSFVLAAAGIGEIIQWRAERDEWQGRAAREEAGTAWLLKNQGVRFHAEERTRAPEDSLVGISSYPHDDPQDRSFFMLSRHGE